MKSHKLIDWVRLIFLVLLWGSAFAINTVAVESASPELVVVGRTWTAAAMMIAWARVQKAELPSLLPRPDPIWAWFAVLALSGVVAPFFLVSFSQLTISSSLTGVLMAMMPLFTALLAHIFVPGEHLTRRGAAGFVLGFVGVAYLIGPDALTGWGGPGLIAQLAVLAAACSYSINAIAGRLSPRAVTPVVVGAGMMVAGSILVIPLAVLSVARMDEPVTLASWSAIIALGVGATGIGAIVWAQLIQSAGPSFMSLVNYLIPVVALIIGAAIGETLPARLYLALPIIMLGVLLVGTQRR